MRLLLANAHCNHRKHHAGSRLDKTLRFARSLSSKPLDDLKRAIFKLGRNTRTHGICN